MIGRLLHKATASALALALALAPLAGQAQEIGGGGSGGGTPANPTASVGSSAVNGSATTYMRSDAAPPLADTTVSAGAYTNTNLTVDAKGRITAAASGSGASSANPSATGGCQSATNGAASTFLRSDGAPALATTAVAAGSYTSADVTVDACGRITAAATGASSGWADASLFGDGSDGDVSVSTSISLSRDMYYHNLTLSSGGSIDLNGWRVFVSGTLDLSAAGAAAIKRNGSAGSNASGATGGAFAVGTLSGIQNGGSTPFMVAGNNGSNGGTGNGTNGSAFNPTTAYVNPTGTLGGDSGAGGAGSGGRTGGASATATATPWTGGPPRQLAPLLTPPLAATGINGNFTWGGVSRNGQGGGAGGGDGSNSGGGGGGAPIGAGMAIVSARTIARGTNSTAGIIQAVGGQGGNGGVPPTGNCGGGGGGSGAAGGFVLVVWRIRTGSIITAAIDVSPGKGGNGGNAVGTGTGGNAGGSGQGGWVALFDIGAGTATFSQPTTNRTSTVAAVGATGATAGSAPVSQVNL